MARVEPIVGRYVYVPYEGKEYRVFYEEAGQGIPLVCRTFTKTESTARRVKNSECIIMEEIGHFPMSENPDVFNRYLMPVLDKILAQK